MASVTLKKIWKKFGDTTIIKDVSVDIADGQFCVLVGPSGSGKSTLLRLIAGLEDCNAGGIHIGDRDVTTLAAKDRDIAMVFQSYALYPQMTVRENMGFGLKLAGVKRQDRELRVDDAARKLNLTALLDRYPKQLSGGQRQRVAMGRAIVRNPQVFLFDEPLSNLDAALRTQVRAEIRELHRSLGTTSVYVTHDQIEAMTLGDRIVVLREGMVEQVGSPLELYDAPANTFVASFIGSPSINLFSAQVVESGGVLLAQLADQQCIALPAQAGLQVGLSIVIGLRPEHLRLASDATRGQQVIRSRLPASSKPGRTRA
ncbi:MAG: sn-glycerol-3-phosphate ABC transporter ATP-binding protein UgpC [Brachymonas sp.]|nr:sn-glycerol-3-phosphate ABC transporter ATP-binding protein UgpC [Brachymonas sp.]